MGEGSWVALAEETTSPFESSQLGKLWEHRCDDQHPKGVLPQQLGLTKDESIWKGSNPETRFPLSISEATQQDSQGQSL